MVGLLTRTDHSGLCDFVSACPLFSCLMPVTRPKCTLVVYSADRRRGEVQQDAPWEDFAAACHPVISVIARSYAGSFSNASSSLRTDTLVPIFFICVSSSFSPPARRISRSSIARIFFCRPLIFLALGF